MTTVGFFAAAHSRIAIAGAVTNTCVIHREEIRLSRVAARVRTPRGSQRRSPVRMIIFTLAVTFAAVAVSTNAPAPDYDQRPQCPIRVLKADPSVDPKIIVAVSKGAFKIRNIPPPCTAE